MGQVPHNAKKAKKAMNLETSQKQLYSIDS